MAKPDLRWSIDRARDAVAEMVPLRA